MNKHVKSILALLTLIALAIASVTTLVWQLDRVTQQEIVTQFSQRQLLLVEQTATSVQPPWRAPASARPNAGSDARSCAPRRTVTSS